MYNSILYFQLYQKTPVKFLMTEDSSKELSVSKFLRIFHVQFSETGSNARAREEESYRNFVRYTREVFGERILLQS
jgi:hypothetical protein